MVSLPDGVRLETGEGGLERLVVDTALSEAHVYLLGAHVAHFQPRAQRPVLFMSDRSSFEVGHPIRGGVPVCFPWFGQKAGSPDLPNHGLVRQRPWALQDVAPRDDGRITAMFTLQPDARVRAPWPHACTITHRICVGADLHMELLVTNTGRAPFTFEEALHTYLRVSDVRHVEVHGLEDAPYRDKLDAPGTSRDPGPILVSEETDRVYEGSTATCDVVDRPWARRLRIAKTGSRTTVVWNPWVDKARRMPDFGDEEWPRMLCVETANAGADAVTLQPGQTHRMGALVAVEGGPGIGR